MRRAVGALTAFRVYIVYYDQTIYLMAREAH